LLAAADRDQLRDELCVLMATGNISASVAAGAEMEQYAHDLIAFGQANPAVPVETLYPHVSRQALSERLLGIAARVEGTIFEVFAQLGFAGLIIGAVTIGGEQMLVISIANLLLGSPPALLTIIRHFRGTAFGYANGLGEGVGEAFGLGIFTVGVTLDNLPVQVLVVRPESRFFFARDGHNVMAPALRWLGAESVRVPFISARRGGQQESRACEGYF
jgi:hypothetical protein